MAQDKLAVRATSLLPSSEKLETILPYRSLMKLRDLNKGQKVRRAMSRLAMMTNRVISPAILAAYGEHLEPLSAEVLVEMFELAERKCKFFPTVAELLALVGEGEEDSDEEIRRHWENEKQTSR